jgi:acetyl esterase/lipase
MVGFSAGAMLTMATALVGEDAKAKKPAEFHLYEQGGHGFGMYPKETTSTGWFNAFVSWLTMHGMLKPKA